MPQGVFPTPLGDDQGLVHSRPSDPEPQARNAGEQHEGCIKWFDPLMGFGFIEHPDGDVFVHRTELQCGGTIEPGLRVSYVMRRGPRGIVALHVRPANPE